MSIALPLFRLWDTKKQKWFGQDDPNCLTFKDFTVFGECTEFFRPNIDYLQYLILEQYTHLDDCTHTKAYVNDIIKTPSVTPNLLTLGITDKPGVIQYDKKHAKYIVNNIDGFFIGNLDEWLNIYKAEIIGNIHENYNLILSE